MIMDQYSKILYGGFEGTESEVCENCKSLGELLLKKFQEIGNGILLVDGITGEQFSGYEVRDQAVHLARCLQQVLGLKTGEIISICSENRIEFAILFYAAILIGVTVAPMNFLYTERELYHVLNLSKPRFLFISESSYQQCLNAKKNNSFIEHIIVFPKIEVGPSVCNLDEVILFEELIGSKIENLSEFICEPLNMRDAIILILCSSGTTGLPKGVQLTQYNLCMVNVQVKSRKCDNEGPTGQQRTTLAYLPLFHTFGTSILLLYTLQRSKLVILPRFTEVDFLQCIETYRVTTVFAVPPIIIFLAKSPIVENYDLRSLECLWSAAAPLGKELETDIMKRLKLKAFREAYGLTESTFMVIAKDDDFHSNGSVGRILRGVSGRVVDCDGNLLGENEAGEVQLKGDCLMKDYIGNPQATSATIDSDGWLHTGDVGYYNENGEWFIVDRLKELIKYKGFQVAPAELESILLSHENIRDAGVIGIPDAVCGELPFAFVVRQPNSTLTEKNVIAFIAGQVSPQKRLHGGVEFVDTIPKNPSGKILRRVLREMAQNK